MPPPALGPFSLALGAIADRISARMGWSGRAPAPPAHPETHQNQSGFSRGFDGQSPKSRLALIAAIAGARLLDSWPSACARERLRSPGEVAPAESFRI